MAQRKKCSFRKTLKNATLDAKIGVDTAKNEPRKDPEQETISSSPRVIRYADCKTESVADVHSAHSFRELLAHANFQCDDERRLGFRVP